MVAGDFPVTFDAVVVVPGIMGSELVDAEGIVWGLQPTVLAKAWLSRRMESLKVTENDLAGGGRIRATRLLRVPGYMPLLGGIEPYSALLKKVATRVVDSRALIEFPYDWRLSIEYNASILAARCEQHWAAWKDLVRTNGWADPADVRLVVVAHSMGGLLVRYATAVHGLSAIVRRIVTLGTP